VPAFDATEAVGALAAALTTASFVPQAVRLIARKDTAAISLTMYLVFAVGIALWLVYGLALGRWPIIAANVVTLALVGAIIAAKLRYG
jgi:MtN3 and saliva related transmembrane protein